MRSAADERSMADRFESWLAGACVRGNHPAVGMRKAGLLEPVPDNAGIARTKAIPVERTGGLGLASVWGDPQRVGRHFLGRSTEVQRAEWLGRSLAVAISDPPAALRSAKSPR